MAKYLVLLGTPSRSSIFRISRWARLHRRENSVARPDIDGELTKIAGRRCAAWVNARKDSDKIRLVETRNYIPRQTAFYAHAAFEKEAAFLEFLEAFPHHGLDARLAKIAEERDALAADLDRRRVRRDFDLSRVGDEQQRIKSCATIRRDNRQDP